MNKSFQCGGVQRITMGLNKQKKQPCGFCFVEFRAHEEAARAAQVLAGAVVDQRRINVDLDAGFVEGRQFGRGESGNQWRDDFRSGADDQRGGSGLNLLKKVEGDEEGKQIYVGKLKHSHGKTEDGKTEDGKTEEGKKREKDETKEEGEKRRKVG